MPVPWLPLATAGLGFFGDLFSGGDQPQAPQFQPPQSPFNADLVRQIQFGLSGQLTPAQSQLFDEARERGEKTLQANIARTPSGAFSQGVGNLEESLARGQLQTQDMNRNMAMQLAAQMQGQQAQQNQFGFQADFNNFLQQMQQAQQNQGFFQGVSQAGLEGLLAPDFSQLFGSMNTGQGQVSPELFNLPGTEQIDQNIQNLNPLPPLG
jgi:hypothetical protein